MKAFAGIALMLTALTAMLPGVTLADEVVAETRAIDAGVLKIRLNGVIDLELKQGEKPSLVIYAEKRWLNNIVTEQTGNTLRIDTDISGFHARKPRMRAELTLPALRELAANGVGASDVKGFSGDELRLFLSGTGAMSVGGHYKRVHAHLGGTGSMQLDALESDSVDVSMSGVGRLVMNGHSKALTARLSGLGNLDAQQLLTETATVDLSGFGSASVHARQAANMTISGMGTLTVYGQPFNRNSHVSGMGKLNWN